MKIKEANAFHTGSSIWCFYGALDDGNYFMADDNGWVGVYNADPLSDLKQNDFSSTYEWQEEHLVRELEHEERMKFCDELLDYIYENPDHDGGMTEQEIEVYRNWFRSDTY